MFLFMLVAYIHEIPGLELRMACQDFDARSLFYLVFFPQSPLRG